MRFIHTADIHLGAVPDIGYPWSEKRAKEIWDSFRNLIQTVKEKKVDLLLIAGDLFHRQPLVRELKEVNYLFSLIPETCVVLMAGNHDYLKADSYYTRFPWNDNVYGLWADELQELCLAEIDTWIYGLSYHSREITEQRYQSVRPNGQPGHHILLAHGGDDKHIPLALDELRTAGFDYIALGHIHRPWQITDKIAYAGALEPLDRNDIGAHGYIAASCGKEGVKSKFVASALRSYIPLTFSINCDTTHFSLEEQIKARLIECGEANLYKILLQGLRDPDTVFQADYLKELGNILEVRDSTSPDYDLYKMKEQYADSLVGAYIEHFMDQNETAEKKALYYGLQALLDAKR